MWGGFRDQAGGGRYYRTVYWLRSNTRSTRVRGRGELSPARLSTTLSTLQCSLQCSLRTACSICTVVSTMRYNSVDNTLYIESLLTTTFSLPRSYHFFVTFTFSSLSLSRYCSSRVPTFSIFEPFFPALFLDAIQIFLDFSLRLSSSRHVALREGLTSCDFIEKQSEVTICLEQFRFVSRDCSC